MGTIVIGVLLGIFLVLALVVAVLLMNPPERWVRKMGKDEDERS
jgi:hypothetical protein